MSACASRLKHPNIIPVNLFIEDLAHGCVYVEFPLYDQDMEAWLKTAPSYPDVHASVHDILRAIEHMHRARVVHCDIRPKNILMKQRVGVADADGVTGKWQATLADFDVSLNSGARATIWQTRTEGPRGFDGMLTMAPELRAPLFQGCTPASDMFSFGGLLYVALYPQISPAMVKTSGNGDIEVGAHEDDVDVAPLVRSLLQKDSKDRPSASEALAHPLFATAGANLLAQVQEQQRELARLHEENRREEEEAKRRLAEKRRKVQEDERKLEQKQERLQQDSSALRHKDRQQQEKERQLREDRESVRREKAKLKEDQEREEIAQRKRQELLDKKGVCMHARVRACLCVCVPACVPACVRDHRSVAVRECRPEIAGPCTCMQRRNFSTSNKNLKRGSSLLPNTGLPAAALPAPANLFYSTKCATTGSRPFCRSF